MPLSLPEVPRIMDLATDRFPELLDFNRLALVRLIQAEADAVERHAGPAAATETFLHQRQLPQIISLIRPIATITAITERRTLADIAVEVDPTDFRQIDPWRIMRLGDGLNPAYAWGTEVVVSYEAEVDLMIRDKVIVELVHLAVNYRVTSRTQETIGDYSISTVDADHAARRAEILAQITEGRGSAIFL